MLGRKKGLVSYLSPITKPSNGSRSGHEIIDGSRHLIRLKIHQAVLNCDRTPLDNKVDDENIGFGTYRYRTWRAHYVDLHIEWVIVVSSGWPEPAGAVIRHSTALTGFGFALLYTFVGIPLARFADASHRVWIMTVCVALWSLMTVLCGLYQVTIGSMTIGAFWVLLVCKLVLALVRLDVPRPQTH